MAEDKKNDVLSISYSEFAGALFRLAFVVFSFLAAAAWNQLKGDIAEVKAKLTLVRERVDSQFTRIAVIESTAKRTEALVADDSREIKDHEKRLSRVENRCCK